MGLLSIKEMIDIIRKNLLRIIAASILVGIVTYLVAGSMQTYTCVLDFKFNNEGAADGLAPDGKSKLDPYEIQNPVVIQGALNHLGHEAKDIDVKGIRQNVSISKVITGLDSEVSKSAALLGEKYEAPATEFEMKLKYKQSLGEKFGTTMFGAIINEYDKFLLNKYYNKNTVTDFAKIVKNSTADYIDIADIMGDELDSISAYLYDMADSYPDYRSKNTGYSFEEVASLYDNLRNIQHAKYYGNVRAANLAKDPEMVIKGYRTKAKELEEEERVSYDISLNYKSSITTFYDSYKAAGLYRQAENVQSNTDSSNNRDQDVLYDFDVENNRNTYDQIVTNFVDNAVNASNCAHTVDYYNEIVQSFENDMVDEATKQRLLTANEQILDEICVLSAEYSEIANKTIEELLEAKVTSDLQYLIAPEIVENIPTKLVTVFVMVVVFGLIILGLLFIELAKRFMKQQEENSITENEIDSSKKIIDKDNLNELQLAVYEQYLNDFNEFYLVYQEMRSNAGSDRPHMETFIRWRSEKLGLVSPTKIIDTISSLGIFEELNDWIFKNVCKDIVLYNKKHKIYPVVHVNCPQSELDDFALNDIIVKYINENKVPTDSICLELTGQEISDRLEEIMLIKKMGVCVCIDRFENSLEDDEIIGAVEPDYIKMSVDILNYDTYATTAEDYRTSALDAASYILNTVNKCKEKGIKTCVCGIENEEQDSSVSKLFDYRQGFYYGKPERLKF